VPQGFTIGPKQFLKYAGPIALIARKYGLEFHGYADDSQMSIKFKPKDNCTKQEAIRRVQQCVAEIKLWMGENYLKLNEDKTELIIIQKDRETLIDSICLLDCNINATKSAKNLGVIFDSNLTMELQINAVTKKAFSEIRNISRIRKYLNQDATQRLVQAYVVSKVDYCNSLLVGVAKKHLNKLTRVQHVAARLITRTRRGEVDTIIIMKSLHWLPIPERITYKILIITFKAFHGIAPKYLCDLINLHRPTRNLRSGNQNQLDQPNTRLKGFGDRAFAKCAPVLWNKLPVHLRKKENLDDFKKCLKTHLFSAAYKC